MSNVHVFRNKELEAVFITASARMHEWTSGPIMTYTTALENAHQAYMSKRNEQDKVDKLQMEVVFLVGFVAAGALVSWGAPLIAAGVASTTGGAMAKRIAQKLPGWNGAATISNTGVVQGVISGVKSEARTLIKTHSKSAFLSHSVDGGPEIRSIADVKWTITQNAVSIFKFLVHTAEDIDKSDCSDADKSMVAQELGKAPFLKRVEPIANRKAELQMVMEYTFFLNHIMDMDKKVTTTTTFNPYSKGSGMIRHTTTSPIGVGPSNPNYPTSTITSNNKPDEFGFTETSVSYDDPGNTVAKRVNELYHDVNKRSPGSGYKGGADFMDDSLWFSTGVGAKQISRAESELTRIANRYSSQMVFKDMAH